MKIFGPAVLTLSIGLIAVPALAGLDDQHKTHQPTEAAAKTADALPAPTAGKPDPQIARVDMQMDDMRKMHEKMMGAKTPAEREALSVAHRKMMQDGMKMMSGMGCTMPADHQMMEKRMDMMQAMMQMMMDRMPMESSE